MVCITCLFTYELLLYILHAWQRPPALHPASNPLAVDGGLDSPNEVGVFWKPMLYLCEAHTAHKSLPTLVHQGKWQGGGGGGGVGEKAA